MFAVPLSMMPSTVWIPSAATARMLAYAEAAAECEAKARLPLAPPVALNARTRVKLANWGDPAMLAKLADAYARAKNHEQAARLLGVTLGAARLAKRRYLDRTATDAADRRGPVGGRSFPEAPPPSLLFKEAAVTWSWAA